MFYITQLLSFAKLALNFCKWEEILSRLKLGLGKTSKSYFGVTVTTPNNIAAVQNYSCNFADHLNTYGSARTPSSMKLLYISDDDDYFFLFSFLELEF